MCCYHCSRRRVPVGAIFWLVTRNTTSNALLVSAASSNGYLMYALPAWQTQAPLRWIERLHGRLMMQLVMAGDPAGKRSLCHMVRQAKNQQLLFLSLLLFMFGRFNSCIRFKRNFLFYFSFVMLLLCMVIFIYNNNINFVLLLFTL